MTNAPHDAPKRARPTLSICIPTYNRAALLEDALRALHADLRALADPSSTEVVVVDNASSDATPDVIERWRATLSPYGFTAVRRPENIGSDNVYLCAEFATGEFVLLLSDDDLLLPGTLGAFFAALAEHPAVDAVSFGVAAFLETPGDLGPPGFAHARDEWTADGDEMLRSLAGMLAYMSILVYRRSLVENTDYTFARGNNLIQSYAFCDVLKRGVLFLRSSHVGFAYRDDNSHGWSYFKVMVTNFSRLVDYADRIGFRTSTTSFVRRWHLRRMIVPKIVHFKERGAFGTIRPEYRDGLRRLLQEYRKDPLMWFVALPLLLLPSFVARGVRAAWRALKAARRAAGRAAG